MLCCYLPNLPSCLLMTPAQPPPKARIGLSAIASSGAFPNRHEFLYLKGFTWNDFEPDDDQRSFKV